MHRVLVRLPAVVALAVTLAGYPALALATPPSATASHVTAPVRGRAAVRLATDGSAEPQDATTAPAHDMEGMESTDDMEGMEGMEGMDHGSAESESSEEHAVGHTDEATSAAPRPRVAVLSAFAGLNAAVLLTAAVLRRRKRGRPLHGPRPAATATAS